MPWSKEMRPDQSKFTQAAQSIAVTNVFTPKTIAIAWTRSRTFHSQMIAIPIIYLSNTSSHPTPFKFFASRLPRALLLHFFCFLPAVFESYLLFSFRFFLSLLGPLLPTSSFCSFLSPVIPIISVPVSLPLEDDLSVDVSSHPFHSCDRLSIRSFHSPILTHSHDHHRHHHHD